MQLSFKPTPTQRVLSVRIRVRALFAVFVNTLLVDALGALLELDHSTAQGPHQRGQSIAKQEQDDQRNNDQLDRAEAESKNGLHHGPLAKMTTKG